MLLHAKPNNRAHFLVHRPLVRMQSTSASKTKEKKQTDKSLTHKLVDVSHPSFQAALLIRSPPRQIHRKHMYRSLPCHKCHPLPPAYSISSVAEARPDRKLYTYHGTRATPNPSIFWRSWSPRTWDLVWGVCEKALRECEISRERLMRAISDCN